MNILITGATGLIGSALFKKLRNQHQVTILTRNQTKAYKTLGHDVQVITHLNELENLDNINAVINLAGEPIANKRWSRAQKKRIKQSRFNITEQLVGLIQKSSTPPHVVISGSAVGYYGRQGATQVTEENNEPHNEFSHRLCAQWESIASRTDSATTRVCLIRTGIVLAKHGGALPRMAFPFKLGVGGPVGKGEQMMSWIHLDDIVDLIIYLLNNEETRGVYNATAPNPVTNNEFSEVLAKVLHRPKLFRVPPFAIRTLFGEMGDALLLHGQAVLPARIQATDFQFRHPTIKEALSHCYHDTL